MEISAESIAGSLDQGRRVKANSYTACCPAHPDKSPSLSISQKSDKVLLYCHSGCRQDDVIDALRSRGLWHEKSDTPDPKPFFTEEELEYANLWCVTYRDNVKKGYTPTPEEDAKFRKYSDLCYREGVAYAQ